MIKLLSNELLTQKFNDAKSGNQEAIRYLINYFLNNVEKQLDNLELTSASKKDRVIKGYKVIVRNLKIYYDVEEFLEKTYDDMKNLIYLNRVDSISGGSRGIIESQKNITSKVTEEDLDALGLPAKTYTIARLFFIENRSIENISNITSDNETIICVRIRSVLNRVNAKKSVKLYTN